MSYYSPSTFSLLERIQPAAGAVVLAMTASAWITRTHEYVLVTRTDSLEQVSSTDTQSLWQLFAVVRDPFLVPLGFGVLIIVGFALVAIVTRRRPRVVLVLAVGSALAALVMMLLADAGYGPGPGAWVALLVSVAVAGAAVTELVRRPSAVDR